MTRAQERIGRRIARALQGLEFRSELVDGGYCDAEWTDEGIGPPRVEVRHPEALKGGRQRLVAVVALEPEPRVSYASAPYRAVIERTLRRVLARRVA